MISILLILFLIGACIGSFLGVCIDRIPKNESIIFRRSHCICGKKIPFYLNIPILAWIILRAHTKCCGTKIPIKFFIVEFLSGLLLPTLFVIYHNISEIIIYSILIYTLLVASFIDIETFKVSEKLSIGLVVVGIIVSTFYPQIHNTQSVILSLQRSFLGLLVGSGLLFWIGIIGEQIFKKEAIGLGDVQIIGAIGTFCGINGCLISIFGGSLVGTIIMSPIIIKKYMFPKNKDQLNILPFVPFLTLGTVLFVFLHNFIILY